VFSCDIRFGRVLPMGKTLATQTLQSYPVPLNIFSVLCASCRDVFVGRPDIRSCAKIHRKTFKLESLLSGAIPGVFGD
jgi:hypothetical protein